MIEIRPATREDLKEFFGEVPNCTMKVMVMTYEGKVVGAGGFSFSHGIPAGFMDLKEEAYELPGFKKALISGTKEMMTYAEDHHQRAYVAARDKQAHAFLKHYGFNFHGVTDDVEVFEWVN